MTLRSMWKSLINEIEATADLKAAELRLGLTVVEAAASDSARTDLAAVVGRINVDLYLEGAVEMAKLGIWPDELQEMGRMHSRAKMLGIDKNDTYLRLLNAEAKKDD